MSESLAMDWKKDDLKTFLELAETFDCFKAQRHGDLFWVVVIFDPWLLQQFDMGEDAIKVNNQYLHVSPLLGSLEVDSLSLALVTYFWRCCFDAIALVNWLGVPLRKSRGLSGVLIEFGWAGVIGWRFFICYFLRLFGRLEILEGYFCPFLGG